MRSAPFILRNAGTGNDFFTLTLRASRGFALTNGVRLEGLVEAFNLTHRVNPLTRNANFRAGAYPLNRSATYPVVAVTSEGPFVAWTSGSQSNAVVRLTRLMR